MRQRAYSVGQTDTVDIINPFADGKKDEVINVL